jgi:uncharacterized protein
MEAKLRPLSGSVTLGECEARTRRDRNRAYLLRLEPRHLLLPHYLEAGLHHSVHVPEGAYEGWESTVSEVHGMMVGHWLSACARLVEQDGDPEVKARADYVVAELARCQKENGGEWLFPIPEKYLHWLKRFKRVWAPQYVCHKNLMGLLDMHVHARSAQALELVLRCADWFHRFTSDITSEHLNRMMEFEETGGMMELWADLYAVTREPKHLELMRRYERTELTGPLARGEDALTNMHANATIPEIQGVARAYEVTGEERYRRIVEAYWDCAVTRRGWYATGGQTSGEIWTPMGRQSARLGELNQEHCTVYNMMRLAEYLLRWTGRAEYADYWERNLVNGIFAQGHWQGRSQDILCEPPVPPKGLIAYFLPLAAGSRKKWGSETKHFWCCHGTLVQANATHREGIAYQDADGVTICQYIPSEVCAAVAGSRVAIAQRFDPRCGEQFHPTAMAREVAGRPDDLRVVLTVTCDPPASFTIRFRPPWWLREPLRIELAGERVPYRIDGDGFACVQRTWAGDELSLIMARGLEAVPLPDRPGTVAFMDGPVVLAGLVAEERELRGDPSDPSTILVPDDEREWRTWKNGWRTVNQGANFRFKPLNEIGNEVYTIYFPVRKR